MLELEQSIILRSRLGRRSRTCSSGMMYVSFLLVPVSSNIICKDPASAPKAISHAFEKDETCAIAIGAVLTRLVHAHQENARRSDNERARLAKVFTFIPMHCKILWANESILLEGRRRSDWW